MGLLGGLRLKTRLDSARRLARRADQARDPRRYADAAEAYRKALRAAPKRTEIRIQYANMLKDAGRLVEAEAAYRSALSERPDEADIYLQLGHCLKLQGRRAAAIDAYQRAAELAPLSEAPCRELFHAGQRPTQEHLFEEQLQLGGVDALMAVTQQLIKMQQTLSRLSEALPDLQAQTAFPVGCYETFRELLDVPAPSRAPGAASFAVLLLADREPLETLFAQIAAVSSQSHTRWTLHVIGSDPARQRIAERAAAADPRIYPAPTNPGESDAEAERRIALSSGCDWALLAAERALLHPRALEWFACVAAHTAATALISDEECGIREHGRVRRFAPELRQTVDYDTLLEMNTCGETVAVELAAYAAEAPSLATGSVSACRSSLLLALARHHRIGHIPHPLVCRDRGPAGDPAVAAAAHEEAVRTHVAAASLAQRIQIGRPSGASPRLPILWSPQDPDKEIAVIIPTRDNAADVRRLIESLRATAALPDGLRVLVVDNGSREAETRRTLAALATAPWLQVLAMDEPFNWSRLNNRAAEAVSSPLLVFANDDMAMLSEGWDERLRGILERPEIGGVGARLLYPDDTLQHAGVLFGWKGSVIHDGLYESRSEPGPANRWQVSRAVGAVTGAFLATRRDTFLGQGGFDEIHLMVAYSDIDYAFKLRQAGLRILWTPEITLYHHESKTRGLDQLDPEKRARERAERAVMEARWGAAMTADPGLNPVWHMASLPFRLISSPSENGVWAHIERCAAADPWLPQMPAARISAARA